MSDRIIDRLGAGAFLLGWPYYCLQDSASGSPCYRAKGHHGRHATIGLSGWVREVWGEDVHAAARAKGRIAGEFVEAGRILTGGAS